VLNEGKMKKRTKPCTRMNAKELAAATAKFDKEFVIDQSRKTTPAERQQWRRAKSKRITVPRDARGNYPAAEALQVSIARSILRQRRAAGLTQVELARLAGIRPETLNRIEKGKHVPSVATVDRLDRALTKAKRVGER
jgi:DNA-binding XRE family transcriptional regulator